MFNLFQLAACNLEWNDIYDVKIKTVPPLSESCHSEMNGATSTNETPAYIPLSSASELQSPLTSRRDSSAAVAVAGRLLQAAVASCVNVALRVVGAGIVVVVVVSNRDNISKGNKTQYRGLSDKFFFSPSAACASISLWWR